MRCACGIGNEDRAATGSQPCAVPPGTGAVPSFRSNSRDGRGARDVPASSALETFAVRGRLQRRLEHAIKRGPHRINDQDPRANQGGLQRPDSDAFTSQRSSGSSIFSSATMPRQHWINAACDARRSGQNENTTLNRTCMDARWISDHHWCSRRQRSPRHLCLCRCRQAGTSRHPREHDRLEALPPRLYEMKIDRPTRDAGPDERRLAVHFEQREVEQISYDYPATSFEKVQALSEWNETLYRSFVSPWITAFANPLGAEMQKWLHPMRSIDRNAGRNLGIVRRQNRYADREPYARARAVCRRRTALARRFGSCATLAGSSRVCRPGQCASPLRSDGKGDCRTGPLRRQGLEDGALFRFDPLGPAELGASIAIGAMSVVWFELLKTLLRRRLPSPGCESRQSQ